MEIEEDHKDSVLESQEGIKVNFGQAETHRNGVDHDGESGNYIRAFLSPDGQMRDEGHVGTKITEEEREEERTDRGRGSEENQSPDPTRPVPALPASDESIMKMIDSMSVVFKKDKNEIRSLFKKYNNKVQIVKTVLCKQAHDEMINKYIQLNSSSE